MLLIACNKNSPIDKVEEINRPNIIENFTRDFIDFNIPFLERKWGSYGHSGVENLHMNDKMTQSFGRFQDSFQELKNFQLIPINRIISDSIYTKLVSNNLTARENLIKTIVTEFYNNEDSIRRQHFHHSENDTIAIISYFSFGGENIIAFPDNGPKLFYFEKINVNSLAHSLGANYVVTVHFDPYIVRWDPKNIDASIYLNYSYRLFDGNGNILIYRKIKYNFNKTMRTELSTWDHAKMVLSALVFSFPTKSQYNKLVLFENSILENLLKESEQSISQDILNYFREI